MLSDISSSQFVGYPDLDIDRVSGITWKSIPALSIMQESVANLIILPTKDVPYAYGEVIVAADIEPGWEYWVKGYWLKIRAA